MASAPIEIVVDDSGPAVIVSACGELDIAITDRLDAALGSVPDDGALVVDLTACDFIDSTVLGRLVHAERRLREGGGRIAVAATPDGAVARLVEITGVGMLPLRPTRDAALAVVA